MTIGERLDRLTHKLELLADDSRAPGVDIRYLRARVAHLFEMRSTVGENIRELAQVAQAQGDKLDKLLTTMDRLANIVIRHEDRLDSLDGAAAS